VPDFFRNRKWDLVGLRNLWFAISLIIIIPGMVAYFTKGLNKGIDFTGGGLVTYHLQEPLKTSEETRALTQVRDAVRGTGVEAQFQFTGSAGRTDQLLIRTRVVGEAGKSQDEVLSEQKAKLLPALDRVFPEIREVAAEMVTGVVSQELIKRAIWTVALGCIFILFWIRLRYPSFQWSVCALIALLHDILVLIGVFAFTQKEVNSPFVAAALTVVGYSVHDTIVIFDRIRENLRLRKGNTFAETVNTSLNETMSRTINTGMTALLVLVVLYFFGGASLRDFTFAMIIGIIVGSYSSIFNAAQLLVVLRSREERKQKTKRAVGRPIRELSPRIPVRQPRPLAPAAQAPMPAQAARPEEAAKAEGEEEEAAATPEELAARGSRRKLKAERKRKRRF
jgi:preprotein translocase subunit SecF